MCLQFLFLKRKTGDSPFNDNGEYCQKMEVAEKNKSSYIREKLLKIGDNANRGSC